MSSLDKYLQWAQLIKRFHVAIAMLALVCVINGCVKHVHMDIVGCKIVESYPMQIPVFEKYKSEHPYKETGGLWLATYLATDVDLQVLANKRGAYSLSWSLFQCPKPSPHEYSFWGGRVFETSSDERLELGLSPEKHLYKIYVPVDLSSIIERTPFLHFPEERELVTEEIKANGLCVGVGGGSMIGTGVESNTVKLPVIIADSPLRIIKVSETGEY